MNDSREVANSSSSASGPTCVPAQHHPPLAALLEQAARDGGTLDVHPRAGEAVIVEIRRLVRLPATLLHFRAHLPPRWRVTLLHGANNSAFLRRVPSLEPLLSAGSVRLMPLPQSVMEQAEAHNRRARARNNGTLLPSGAAFERSIAGLNRTQRDVRRRTYQLSLLSEQHLTRSWYNGLLMTPAFWALFAPREHLLLFEADAVLCARPTLPLDWWAGKYGYVGSPWFRSMGAGFWWCNRIPGCCVGNSGLSLWNRRLMARLLAPRAAAGNASLLTPSKGARKLVDLWIAVELQQLARTDGASAALGGLPAVPTEELAGAFACGEPPDARSAASPEETYTPVGLHGMRNWPQTRGDILGPTCGRRGRRATYRCEQLLARCPAAVSIALNASLDGEYAE